MTTWSVTRTTASNGKVTTSKPVPFKWAPLEFPDEYPNAKEAEFSANIPHLRTSGFTLPEEVSRRWMERAERAVSTDALHLKFRETNTPSHDSMAKPKYTYASWLRDVNPHSKTTGSGKPTNAPLSSSSTAVVDARDDKEDLMTSTVSKKKKKKTGSKGVKHRARVEAREAAAASVSGSGFVPGTETGSGGTDTA